MQFMKHMFRNKIVLAGVMIAIIIPSIYYLIYLGALWDPQNNFKNLPVAIVNQDQGSYTNSESDKKEFNNLGRQLAEELIKDDKFAWQIETKEVAEKGLKEGNYYFMLSIPKDFSAKVLQQGLKPHGLLQLKVNDSLNLITWQTSSRVAGEIRESINNQLSNKFIGRIMDTVHKNQNDLVSNVNKLYNAGTEISRGAKKLQNGVDKAVEANKKLVKGNKDVAEGIVGINKGFKQTLTGQEQVIAGNSQAIKGVAQINEGLKTLANAPINDANVIKSQLLYLAGQNDKAIEGLNKANAGLLAVNGGQNQISAALDKLTVGSGQLSQGSQEFHKGLQRLDQGSTDLYQGINKFSNKQKEFKDAVNSASKEKESVKKLVEPVSIKVTHINKVPNNGTVFSAFFIPLTLWIGAIVLMNVLQQLIVKPQHLKEWMLYSLIIGLISIFQALVVSYAAIRLLGLAPNNVTDFYLVNILTSITFTILIHLIYFILGLPGILLSLIMLILQLPSTGGTYPIQSLPNLYQTISQWMPMTYAIKALKFSISGGNSIFIKQQVEIFSWLIISGIALHFIWLLLIKKSNQPVENI